jgi:putative transcriptional regulator
MGELFEGRSISTRFRVLVSVASRQPWVQQKNVASDLGITVQAVSEHMKELVSMGLVESKGRSSYSVTPLGVDWLLRMAHQLESYSERVGDIVRDISITTAVAAEDLEQGQQVALVMIDGLLHARRAQRGDMTSATVVAGGARGTDVGVTRIEGVIPLSPAPVVVATVPSVREGGSRTVDVARLKTAIGQARLVAAVGIESLAALRTSGVEPACWWSATTAVAEAASAGVPCLLVCTRSEMSRVTERLADAEVPFSLIDLSS